MTGNEEIMKFIDLRDEIVEELHLTESEASGVDAAMRWLQMRPGTWPGRTITEQQLIQLWQVTVEGRNIDDFAQELKDNGITVVPDPEPTNAEKIEALINESEFRPIGYHGVTAASALAHELDKAGVKAPEGS